MDFLHLVVVVEDEPGEHRHVDACVILAGEVEVIALVLFVLGEEKNKSYEVVLRY